jgi:N-methylhydantoinase B
MTNPRGTMLNCEYPAAVGHRAAPARRLFDVLTGTILQAAPETMSSASSGAGCVLWLAEYPEDGGGERSVSVIEYLRGGMGAFIGHDGEGYDGVDARDSTIANLSNNPLEVVERECGVIIRNWDVLPDSGGPGRWRGGAAATCTIEIVRDGGAIYGTGMERMRFPAWGVRGGKPGQLMRIIVNQGRDDEYEVGKIEEVRVDAGDTITVMLPGAGGYGDPYLRDPEAVLRDVRYDFVTADRARRDYGVAIADGVVDEKATAKLRSGRIKDNVRAEFDFGPDREAWESVFDDATMNALNARLFELPVSARTRVRARIFADAIPDLPRCGDGRSVTDVITDADAVRTRLQTAIADAFADAPGPGTEAATQAAQ